MLTIFTQHTDTAKFLHRTPKLTPLNTVFTPRKFYTVFLKIYIMALIKLTTSSGKDSIINMDTVTEIYALGESQVIFIFVGRKGVTVIDMSLSKIEEMLEAYDLPILDCTSLPVLIPSKKNNNTNTGQ